MNGHCINNGKRRSPKTEFKKGHKTWSAGTKELIKAWNKGKSKGYLDSRGYIVYYLNGKEIKEHRLVMERHIGRALLNKEHIHHINRNITDNRIENLSIVTPEDHGRIHYEAKKDKFRRTKKCVY